MGTAIIMFKKFSYLISRYLKRTLIIFFSIFTSLLLVATPSIAARTSMSGDYAKDTIAVVKSLKNAIETPKDASDKNEIRDEALSLITDYISRYRNRGMINTTQSFTTMQTALNAMAGHYKNFATRPLPDKLKERLNKELSIAEKMVLRES